MSHGFDNMADVLTVSPALMEGYIRAAGKISREAVGDPHGAAADDDLSDPARDHPDAPRRRHAVRHARRDGGRSTIFRPMANTFSSWASTTSSTARCSGKNQGKGQQIEVAVNGERVALLDINPTMTLANDGIKTPPIKVKAGPQRISAAFIQKFEGPVEDEYRMVEQSLVDVNAARSPGHDVAAASARVAASSVRTTSPAFRTRPAAARSSPAVRPPAATKFPAPRRSSATLARQAYRRPVTDADLEDLLSFYQTRPQRAAISSPGSGRRMQAIIADPEFVFRFERTSAERRAGHELSHQRSGTGFAACRISCGAARPTIN